MALVGNLVALLGSLGASAVALLGSLMILLGGLEEHIGSFGHCWFILTRLVSFGHYLLVLMALLDGFGCY